MRRVLRLFAAASLLLGLAFLGAINDVFHFNLHERHFGLNAAEVSYLLYLFGFCVAALGFWLTGSVVESARPPESDPEIEPLVPSADR